MAENGKAEINNRMRPVCRPAELANAVIEAMHELFEAKLSITIHRSAAQPSFRDARS